MKLDYKDVVEYSADYVKFNTGRVVTEKDIIFGSTHFKCVFGSINKGNWCRCKQCRVVKFYLSKASTIQWVESLRQDSRLKR